MNFNRPISRPALLALALIAAVPNIVPAKLPEPDAVFFGTVKHLSVNDLKPVQVDEIAVVAKIVLGGFVGEVVGQTVIAPGQNSYLLKIPMDDGQEPRLPGTVRGGEKVKLFLRNIRKSPVLEFETDQTEAALITIDSLRGTVTATILSADQNLEPGALLMARFEQWRAGFDGIPLLTDPSTSDSVGVGDGTSELLEYIADTDPTSIESKFQVLEIRQGSVVNSIRFGPVRLSRGYTIFSSPSLEQPYWQPVGTIRPINGATGGRPLNLSPCPGPRQ